MQQYFVEIHDNIWPVHKAEGACAPALSIYFHPPAFASIIDGILKCVGRARVAHLPSHLLMAAKTCRKHRNVSFK